MNALLLCLATSSLGIDVGWQPIPEGGLEYIIQIEPSQVGRLLKGEDLLSDVPPELNVRRYRISVNEGPLPKQMEPERAAPQTASSRANTKNLDPIAKSNDATADPFNDPSALRDKGHESEAPQLGKDEPDPNSLPGDDRTVTPRTLQTNADVGPLDGQQVKFEEGSASERSANKPATTLAARNAGAAEPKPWLSFTLALLFLCISLGGNIFLAWIAWGARERYRGLLQKLRNVPSLG